MKSRLFKMIAVVMMVFVGVGSAQAKFHGCAYFFFDATANHTYEDENIKAYIENGMFCVFNKTNKMVYIDKSTCFSIVNDVSTNAFGLSLEASEGTLDEGGQTTAVRGKKMIGIPPQSRQNMWFFYYSGIVFRPHYKSSGRTDYYYVDQKTGNKTKLTAVGFKKTFDRNTTPIYLKAFLTYSLTKDLKDIKEVIVDNYLKAFVVDSDKGKNDYRPELLPYCRPFMTDTENYTCWEKISTN